MFIMLIAFVFAITLAVSVPPIVSGKKWRTRIAGRPRAKPFYA